MLKALVRLLCRLVRARSVRYENWYGSWAVLDKDGKRLLDIHRE